MKITKSQLKQIIKEELEATIVEEMKVKNPGKYIKGARAKAGVDPDGDGVPSGDDSHPYDGAQNEDLEEGVFDRFKRKKKAAPKDDGAGGLITAYEARLEKNADVATIKAYEAGGETVNKIHQALVRMSDAGMEINPLTGAPVDQKDEKKFKNFVLKTYPMLRTAGKK